ncbi:MAG: hypothetical protein ACXWLD_00145, partial [Rhizomicrobium sp.]
DHVVYPFGVDVFGFDVAKRMSNVVRFRVALRERFGCSGHVSMQLWGYSAIGDLTVRDGSRGGSVFTKEISEKIRARKLVQQRDAI